MNSEQEDWKEIKAGEATEANGLTSESYCLHSPFMYISLRLCDYDNDGHHL